MFPRKFAILTTDPEVQTVANSCAAASDWECELDYDPCGLAVRIGTADARVDAIVVDLDSAAYGPAMSKAITQLGDIAPLIMLSRYEPRFILSPPHGPSVQWLMSPVTPEELGAALARCSADAQRYRAIVQWHVSEAGGVQPEAK
jgi:hypothetical protein